MPYYRLYLNIENISISLHLSMEFDDALDIYKLISLASENCHSRKKLIVLRKLGFTKYNGFVKNAFDTRRINQETEFNPRRGLQNYNRSEAFISEAVGQKLKSFSKLRGILNSLKEVYGKSHEWQDSNARVLLSTLDSGLRTIQKDGDYSENQQSVGSLNYIEELLHVRYRLGTHELETLADSDLKKIILSKDEELINRDTINKEIEITKNDIAMKGYDILIDKLFSVQATKENKSVKRSINITIVDTILNDDE